MSDERNVVFPSLSVEIIGIPTDSLSAMDSSHFVSSGLSLNSSGLNCWSRIFPLKKISFEDTEFYGPADADGLLTAFYGNYMQLPTVEHRVPHYDNVIFIEAQ